MKKLSKILIANRGEIAVRIIKTARKIGIDTVAVYSLGEENSLHVKMATEAVLLGNGSLDQTYLNITKIIEIALAKSVDAIHPGYGFLSENAAFAKACLQSGLVFIGPSVDVLTKMGNKVIAKSIANKLKINVIDDYVLTEDNIEFEARKFKFPVLIKAAFGGGGKGMHIVNSESELFDKAIVARRTAKNFFGNGDLFVERYIPNARHIEVQIIGDSFGNIVHLFERDCSIQRNYQKIIEEAPATSISNELKNKIHQAALSICSEIAYENAGTVEFLVDENNEFYFLEMNPRIQVEHTVTEQITGVDIVLEQLNVAAGNKLSITQNQVQIKGHAIQSRLYAEDPFAEFRPSAKPIKNLVIPDRPYLRVDTDYNNLETTVNQFDPLLLKLIVTGNSRVDAIDKLNSVLSEMAIVGPSTNLSYLISIIQHQNFKQNNFYTSFCEFAADELHLIVEQAVSAVEIPFIIAASIFKFFPKPIYNDKSIWNSIGHWNPNSKIEININSKIYSVVFHFVSGGLQLKVNNSNYEVDLINETLDSITLSYSGKILKLFTVCIAESVINMFYNGICFQVSSTSLLGYYPFDFNKSEVTIDETSKLVVSNLHGKIVDIVVQPNQTIYKGDLLMVIESMKSENRIVSPRNAKVKKITVSVGDQVADQMPLIYLEDN